MYWVNKNIYTVAMENNLYIVEKESSIKKVTWHDKKQTKKIKSKQKLFFNRMTISQIFILS